MEEIFHLDSKKWTQKQTDAIKLWKKFLTTGLEFIRRKKPVGVDAFNKSPSHEAAKLEQCKASFKLEKIDGNKIINCFSLFMIVLCHLKSLA